MHELHDPISRFTAAIERLAVNTETQTKWFHDHMGGATKRDVDAVLHAIDAMEKRQTMNAQQLEALLNNQTTQIGKIAKEQSDRFDVLTAKIKELQDLIDAGGAITPAIEAAATAVQTALDNLDASIPDAPVV